MSGSERFTPLSGNGEGLGEALESALATEIFWMGSRDMAQGRPADLRYISGDRNSSSERRLS